MKAGYAGGSSCDGAADCRISGNAGIIKKTKNTFVVSLVGRFREIYFYCVNGMEPDDQAAVLTKLSFPYFLTFRFYGSNCLKMPRMAS